MNVLTFTSQLRLSPTLTLGCSGNAVHVERARAPVAPLVADVLERVYGPTAGEDRALLHPSVQPAVQTLMEIARNNARFEAVRHACPSAFIADPSHAVVRL